MKRSTLVLIFFAVLAVGARAAAVDLLIVAPDDATLAPLLKHVTHAESETRAAWTIWHGRLGAKTIALTRSEGDPLNAVAATTLALRRYTPRLVVVCGTARAHDPGLHAGDVVVSERFTAFDGMISSVTSLNAGSASLDWKKLPHLLMTPGEREIPAESFPADAGAAAIALKLAPSRGRVVAGVLGSANQINREADRVARLRDLWHTSSEDSESAHVAGVAALFNTPVVGFRVIDGTPADVADFALRFMEAWK